MDIWGMLSLLGFRDTKKVVNRFNISDIFKGKVKCGVFVLHFPKDTFYIGKSENIPERYSQIKMENDDIVYISFKAVPKDMLDAEKLHAIKVIEGHFSIRNIAQAAKPVSTKPLDVILPISEQEAWLSQEHPVPAHIERAENNTLREKYSRRFRKLKDDAFFLERILPVLKKYVALCIPEPYRTEINFWGCSCLPNSHADEKHFEVYSRIDLFWQEVFTVGQSLDTKQPTFSWHLSKTKILGLSKSDFNSRYSHITTLKADAHFYPKGGEDQFNIEVFSTGEALELLDDQLFVESVKEFNLRNMRRGSHIYAANHCMDLADILMPTSKVEI